MEADQVLVRGLRSSYCFRRRDARTVGCVKARISEKEGVPVHMLSVFSGRHQLRDDLSMIPPSALSCLVVKLAGGLKGGKGGFGAMLKALGKGGKPTTNFGACRDLSGRRLRHVNDEIALRKWRAAQKRAAAGGGGSDIGIEAELARAEEEITESGIDGWHLAVPGWADGVGNKSKRSRLTSMRSKLGRQARKLFVNNLSAKTTDHDLHDAFKSFGRVATARVVTRRHDPSKSRGFGFVAFYNYDDATAAAAAMNGTTLRGRKISCSCGARKSDSAIAMKKREQATERYEEMESAALTSFEAAGSAATDGMGSSVLAGLQRAKEARASSRTGESASASSSSSSSVATKWADLVDIAPAGGSILRSGARGMRLESESNFATAHAPSLGVPPQSGCWYYEVQLITDGLMQIGWINTPFAPNDADGDGVGDGVGSWAYDGMRQRCWHGAADAETAVAEGEAESAAAGVGAGTPLYGKRWASGDIVGCFLDTRAATISFSLNGEPMGVAFADIYAGAKSSPECVLHPAFSLESEEVIAVNLGGGGGGAPFVFGNGSGAFRPIADALTLPRSAFAAVPPPSARTEAAISSSAGVPAVSARVAAALAVSAAAVSAATAAVPTASAAPAAAATVEAPIEDIALDDFASAKEIAALPASRVKHALQLRGLKCGGAPQQRAERLFSIKGIAPSKVPHELLASSAPSRKRRRRSSKS